MEFKKLSAVEAVAEPTETAHVLIEENGVVKRVPKDEVGGINPSKLTIVETIGDDAKVLVEDNGVIKRAPIITIGNMYIIAMDENGSVFSSVGIYDGLSSNPASILMAYVWNDQDGGYKTYIDTELSKNDNGDFDGYVGRGYYHYIIHADNSIEFYYDN